MLITQSDAEEIPTEELVGISLTPPPPKNAREVLAEFSSLSPGTHFHWI